MVRVIRYLFFSSLLLLDTTSLLAQITVRGKVIDGTNQEPLEATMISSESAFTQTDQSGFFEIKLDTLPAKISVSHLGYFTTLVDVQTGSKSLTIPLQVAPTQLNEVIVSSSNQNEYLKDASSSIGIITKQGLARDDQTMITNALNRIPGIYMHTGSLNTNRITIRGIGGRTPFGTDKVRAYFDHIPLTNGVGETSIEDIDLGLIERVEIIKGPNSSIYGAGLGGVINLKPTLSDYQKTSLSSEYIVGSYGLRRLKNTLSFGGDHSNFSLVHGRIDSDGYRQNNQFHRESLGLIGRIGVGDNGHLSILGNYVYLKSFIPSSISQAYYDSIPSAAAPNWSAAQGFEQYDKVLLGVSYTYQLAPHLTNTSSVFVSFRDAFEPRPRPLGILKENTIGSGLRNVLKYKNETGPLPWSVSGGMEYFRDTYDQVIYENLYQQNTGTVVGPSQSDLTEKRVYYNLFLQTDVELSDKFSVELGANVNQTSYQLKDFFVQDSIDKGGNFQFDPILSPRLGFVFHARENRHYYANISHGFSPPNLEETLDPGGALNPNIRPEKGWNYELGARGNLMNGNLQYQASAYYMLIDDLLVSRTDINGFLFGINAGKTNHLGMEFDLNYHQVLTPNYTLGYFINGSITNYRFEDFVDGDNDFSGNQLTGSPGNTFNAGIELISQQGFYANLNGLYTSDIPIDDGNTLYADAYLLMRAKAGFRFQFWKLDIDLFSGVNNLTDARYASMLQINNAFSRHYYPGNPRNYFGGVTVKLGL